MNFIYKNFDYFVHFLIGGFLFLFIHYFSKKNNTKLAALIPTIPILGIYGIILNSQNKNKINIYLKSIIKFVLLALLFYILIFCIYKFINIISISAIISFFIWFCLALKNF